jgi:hypothetical protein
LEQILQKRTRGILEELDNMMVTRNRENVIESRAVNVIGSAINLIRLIKESYDVEVASDLERRLLNAIRSQDSQKFVRGIKKLKE